MGTTSRKEKYREIRRKVEDCRNASLSNIEYENKSRKKAPLVYKQDRFHQRRTELINKGFKAEEIKAILLAEYPDFVKEKLNIKIILQDGTESNAFDIQLEDQIKKYRGNSQGSKGTKNNETDGR